jgi:hypothetical protein
MPYHKQILHREKSTRQQIRRANAIPTAAESSSNGNIAKRLNLTLQMARR